MEADLQENKSVRKIEIVKLKDSSSFSCMDDIAIEEPLEIGLLYHQNGEKELRNISVTMRTPGNDRELAAGFLFTEGIIAGNHQIKAIRHSESACTRNSENRVTVLLAEDVVPQLMKAERNFYTTSSCGVCGKGSIESIRTVSIFDTRMGEQQVISVQVLYQLAAKLQTLQNNFSATGGIHAAGIFDLDGNLLALREDVGRHNALDKLVGHALLTERLPLRDNILLLSGRASFELIQKAAMAGIAIVTAIGAPSSLAIDLAKEFDITLLGFLRDNRFNIYHMGCNCRIEKV